MTVEQLQALEHAFWIVGVIGAGLFLAGAVRLVVPRLVDVWLSAHASKPGNGGQLSDPDFMAVAREVGGKEYQP